MRPAELVSRGTISLKGKSEPIELLTPARAVRAAARTADAAIGA